MLSVLVTYKSSLKKNQYVFEFISFISFLKLDNYIYNVFENNTESGM